jgi:hypothetical protein
MLRGAAGELVATAEPAIGTPAQDALATCGRAHSRLPHLRPGTPQAHLAFGLPGALTLTCPDRTEYRHAPSSSGPS